MLLALLVVVWIPYGCLMPPGVYCIMAWLLLIIIGIWERLSDLFSWARLVWLGSVFII